jgi:hypothetical protein
MEFWRLIRRWLFRGWRTIRRWRLIGELVILRLSSPFF